MSPGALKKRKICFFDNGQGCAAERNHPHPSARDTAGNLRKYKDWGSAGKGMERSQLSLKGKGKKLLTDPKRTALFPLHGQNIS